jgi:hypothetical protein
VRARFDILAASRIDDNIDTDRVSDTSIDSLSTTSTYKDAKRALKSVETLHFPAAFPEVFEGENSGFDVIVGNPPWEKTKVEKDVFWKMKYPGLYEASQTEIESRITELEKERPDLVEELETRREEESIRSSILTDGPYPMGGSDPDLYAGFAWRFWSLIKKGGHVGMVLPRASLLGPKTETLREKVVTEGVTSDLTIFTNNQGWVFENVHPQYSIALWSLSKSEPDEETTFPLRGPYSSLKEYQERGNPYRFSLGTVETWAKTAFPMLPTNAGSVDALQRLADSPKLDEENEEYNWRALMTRELDASQDKEADDGRTLMHFIDDPPESFWPVYKGGSFNLWIPDTGVRYAWADPDTITEYLHEDRNSSYGHWRSPFTEMNEGWISDKETLPCLDPRLAFRQITNRTNRRTIIPALVPPETVLTHHAWYFIWPEGDEQDEAFLTGILSSIPFDWYARRFVESNATKSLMKTFPVPRNPNQDLRDRTIEIAGRLSSIDERYADWADAVGVEYGPLDEETKQQKIYELDAVVAHLYSLTREHVKVIFETFHDGWEHEERLERVLDYYQSWGNRLDLDHNEEPDAELPEAEDDD